MNLRLSTLLFAAILAPGAGAEPLDDGATEALMFRAPWHVQTGGEINYFVWRPDGTLCVTMYDPAADACDDEGPWTREAGEVCYTLDWWGKAVEIHDLCFTVEGGPETFQAKDEVGLTALTFSVSAE